MPHLILPEETIIKALAHSSPSPWPLSPDQNGYFPVWSLRGMACSFSFIKSPFSSSSLSAIRVVSSASVQFSHSVMSDSLRPHEPQQEPQARIKIAGRNINNFRYADDTTLMAESEEELKSLLMKVKVEVKKLA